MAKDKSAQPLNSADLNGVLSGNLRYNDAFKHFYQNHGQTGDHICIDGYEIAVDTGGIVDLKILVSPLILVFKNCVIKELEINHTIKELKFENCKIDRLIFSSGLVGQLTVYNPKNTIKEIIINNSLVRNFVISANIQHFRFKGSDHNRITGSIQGNIDLLEIRSVKDIKLSTAGLIKDCTITSSVYPFQDGPVTIQSLKVMLSTQPSLDLKGIFESIHFVNVSGPIDLSEVICLNDFLVEQSREGNVRINMANTYIGGEMILNDASPEIITIIDGVYNKFVYLNKLTVKGSLTNLSLRRINGEIPLYINHLTFQNIHIAKDIYWSIQGLYCQSIDFIDFRNAGTGNISNTVGGNFEPLQLSYSDLLKNSKSQIVPTEWFLENIMSKEARRSAKTLYLRSSDLGKVNFVDTDFSEFSLSFYSTKLNEIFLAGSKMPKTIKAININRINNDLKHQERIAYSQLKKLHEQQGDLLASNEYFAGEMNAYFESMSWKTDFWEKLPLFLNRISSNHGQSWIRALITTVLVTGVFYAFFLFSLGIKPANPFEIIHFRDFVIASSYFFDFVNPLHKLETFTPLNPSKEYPAVARFIDGIARIFIAYFVYQLIQAFRKHGRFK